MNNVELLKLFNDVDERFLTEEYKSTLNKKYIKFFKERMSKMINKKVKYILTPALTFAIALVSIVTINNSNEKVERDIAKSKEIILNDNNCADKIIFNDISTIEDSKYLDLDGRFEEKNLTEQFKFLKNLDIPEYINSGRQGELYVKENITDKEYTKLRQYCLFYSSHENDSPSSSIDIIFTREITILDDYFYTEEDKISNSIINGKKIKIFKAEYPYEKGKISGIALFEIDGYKIQVDVSKISESEFINLIKSMIN